MIQSIRETRDLWTGLIMLFGLLGIFMTYMVYDMYVNHPIDCSKTKTDIQLNTCHQLIFNGYLLCGLPDSIAIISTILFFISRTSGESKR